MRLTSFKILKWVRRPLEVELLRWILGISVLLPAGSWLAWKLNPGRPLEIFILDKTAGGVDVRKHRSLNWILNNARIRRDDGADYDPGQDYWGYFPIGDGDFRTKDLETFSAVQIDSLAKGLDLVYVADTYGIYYNDLYSPPRHPNPLIYGGLYKKDLDLLQAVKDRGGVIVTEFNSLGESTPPNARRRFLAMFGLQYTGWSGRYFDSLDSTKNSGVPAWVFRLYQQEHPGSWPYRRSGVILVSDEDELLVLESGGTLENRVPSIRTISSRQKAYSLPDSVPYTYWFDVVFSQRSRNDIISYFDIPVTAAGDSLLASHRLSPVFPAVLGHVSEEYSFYYLAGDFSDNPIHLASSHFAGVQWVQTFFYNPRNVLDRRAFFWRYYRPLMMKILEGIPPER